MIVSKMAESVKYRYIDCAQVLLVAKDETTFEGTLLAGEVPCRVKLVIEDHGSHLEARLWGSVIGFDADDIARRMRVAGELQASESLPFVVAVDVHDGDTLLYRHWDHRVPSTTEVDEVLAGMAAFVSTHAHELLDAGDELRSCNDQFERLIETARDAHEEHVRRKAAARHFRDMPWTLPDLPFRPFDLDEADSIPGTGFEAEEDELS